MTGIEVEFDMTPFGSLLEKITSEGVAMTGTYDIITYLDSWGPSIKQFLVPLDDRISDAGIDMDRYPPAFQQAVTYDAMVHGFPWRGHPQLLFYREDIMKELDLDVPTTWAELEEVALAITENTDLYGLSQHYASHAGQNLFNWITLLWSNGGQIFDDNWKPVFNNSAGVEATERYVGFLRDLEVTPPGSVTYNEYESVQSMVQGESAMVISWWWQYQNLVDKEKAIPEVAENAAFAPVPEWEGKGGATYAICMPLSIMKDSNNQDAAWEFLKWATNPDLEKTIATDKSDPNTTTNVTVQVSSLKDPEVNEAWDGMHKAAAESLAVSRIMPQIPEWPEVSDVLSITINKIATGDPVKASLDQAASSIEEIMERAGYY
jgi:multiple sugar transport system substrate-binding protein